MTWITYDIHLSGSMEDVLTPLVEELTGLTERLRTGEGKIGRGTPRGKYTTLRINLPVVTWEHEAEHGDVGARVRVSGYDLMTVPGAVERQQDVGELVGFTLSDWGTNMIGVRVGWNDATKGAVDVVASVLWRLDDRWSTISYLHSYGVFRGFERALHNMLAQQSDAVMKRLLEEREAGVAPEVPPAPEPSATPPAQPAGEPAAVERAEWVPKKTTPRKLRGPNTETQRKLRDLFTDREGYITRNETPPGFTKMVLAAELTWDTAVKWIPKRLREVWSERKHWEFSEFSEVWSEFLNDDD
jgi:hypothetical protein